MAESGDKVTIKTNEKEFTGILMPTKSDTSTFLKLSSGYNIGILKSKITSVSVVQKSVSKPKAHESLKPKHGLKNVIILYTGGTIASKVDYVTGGVVAQSGADELVSFVPELKDIVNISTEQICNIMSEDMDFSGYADIIAGIKKHLGKVDGIIIGHGTDTLGYSAAALSFVFENAPLPILLIGSQRSSDRASSDAAMHLICAAQFIAKTDFKGVAVCMHHSSNDDVCAILPGTRTRKMHTSRRDAFKAINSLPLALVDEHGAVKWITSPQDSKGALLVREHFSSKVGFLKSVPNVDSELLSFATNRYAAIVFEATGLGHLPTNIPKNEKHYALLKDYLQKGGIVAITSQCINGRVQGTVYTNLRRLLNIGCIFCEDMIPETAYIKLCWLLGNFTKDEARTLLAKNLRCEISDRSVYVEEFLE